jgi:hypothetical protein
LFPTPSASTRVRFHPQSLTEDESSNCLRPSRVSISRKGAYETGTVSTCLRDTFSRRLRGSRRLLCCRTSATAGCGRSRLRTGTRLCVDRWLLRLAWPLCLGPRLLGSAAASSREVGAGPRLLQSRPLFLPPGILALTGRRGLAVVYTRLHEPRRSIFAGCSCHSGFRAAGSASRPVARSPS